MLEGALSLRRACAHAVFVFALGCGQSGAPGGSGAGGGAEMPSGSGGSTAGGGSGGSLGGVAGGGSGPLAGAGMGGSLGGTGGSAAAAGAGGVAGASGTAGNAGSSGGSGGMAGGAGAAGSLGWSCPPGPFPSDPLPPGVSPMELAGVPPMDGFAQGLHILEAAIWVGDSLYVPEISGSATSSSGPQGRILKISGGAVSVWAEGGTGMAGLALHPDGRLIGARYSDGSISAIDLDDPGSITVIAAGYGGTRFNSPNGIAVRSDGNIYFSDPTYLAPSGTPPQPVARVYRVSPDGTVFSVDESRQNPNGVTLSLDQNTLYVSGSDGVFRYPLAADGSTGTGTPLSGSLNGSDGMTTDCAGNIYVTQARNVIVLSPAEIEIDRFTVPQAGVSSATSVAFGGEPEHHLYIPTLGSSPKLFRLDLTRCGDGRVSPGEGCDDGNEAAGDGCSASCTPE